MDNRVKDLESKRIGSCVLVCHPDSAPSEPFGVTVDIARFGSLLELRYQITGPTSAIRLPEPRSYKPERADGLWAHTCYEAFWRPDVGTEYFEYNFAPSRAFAIYRFTAYRVGMEAILPDMPRIFYRPPNDGSALDIRFGQPFDGPSRLALSAVIEETDGTKSYWALKHPPGPPDFHHPDCFALTLPAPE
jgi:hypothetical protein